MQVDNARQVSECGFCILEGVYDDGECEQMRSLYADGSVRLGGITAAAPRLVFHPLLELAPELAPFFANQSLIDTMAAVFQDDVRLAHSGAAVNDNALWHCSRAGTAGRALPGLGQPDRARGRQLGRQSHVEQVHRRSSTTEGSAAGARRLAP